MDLGRAKNSQLPRKLGKLLCPAIRKLWSVYLLAHTFNPMLRPRFLYIPPAKANAQATEEASISRPTIIVVRKRRLHSEEPVTVQLPSTYDSIESTSAKIDSFPVGQYIYIQGKVREDAE